MHFLSSLAIAAGALLSTASAQFAGAIDARSTPLSPEVSRHLPPKTYSGVCPAVQFDQSWARVNGHYYIKFKPTNPSLPFDFVDLHLVLVDSDRGDTLVGEPRNYAMQRPSTSKDMDLLRELGSDFDAQAWYGEVKDPMHLAALTQMRTDVSLQYSFTYCVGIGGKPTDCDTEGFAIQLITFEYRASLVECPTQCGMPATTVIPPAVCIGSDGMTYSEVHCANMPRPAAVQCPATPACVTFNWRAGLAECNTECGMPATSVNAPASCYGSDGQEYSGQMCNAAQLPGAQMCQATRPCNWRAGLVECPTNCGYPGGVIQQEAMCVNDNGLEVDYNRCALSDAPGAVQCPPMAACAPTLEYIGTKYLTVGHGHKKKHHAPPRKHHGPPAFKKFGGHGGKRHGKSSHGGHGSYNSFETSSSLLSSSSGYAGYGGRTTGWQA